MASNVTFLGNCKFEQDSDPVWTGGGYELDECRIPYRGAATLKEEFINSLTRGKFAACRLPGLDKMFYVDHRDDGDKVFPTVEVIYRGFRNRKAPDPQAVDSRPIQTAQSQVTGPTGSTYEGKTISLEIQYRAYRTDWTFFATSDPSKKAPDFVKCRNAKKKPDLMRWHVTDDKGGVGSLDSRTFTALANTLGLSEQITEYVVSEIAPGQLWSVQASVDLLIVTA